MGFYLVGIQAQNLRCKRKTRIISIFQEGGAPRPFSRQAQEISNQNFRGRKIGRLQQLIFSAFSCSVNPFDFYILDQDKSQFTKETCQALWN